MNGARDIAAAANTARVEAGRLVEIAADAGYRAPEDVDAIFVTIDTEAGRLLARGLKCIVVADWRRCPLMSPEAAARLKDLMAQRNARILRSAGLVSSQSPAAVLQFARVTREAGLPDRKTFDDPRELARWLADVTTPAEAARLDRFLGVAP
jgi:hypothetical protein